MSTLYQLVNGSYRLTIAHQRWVLSNMRAAAVGMGHVRAVSLLDHAATIAAEANRVERQYEVDKARQADARDANDLDRLIGQVLGAIYAVLGAQAAFGHDDPRGRRGEELQVKAFPGGLRGHVTASYTEKANLNGSLVELLASNENVVFVVDSGLEPLVSRLATLNERFVRLISFEPEVTFEQVQAARRRSGEALLEAVLAVATSFRSHVPAEVELRETVLMPYRELMAKIGAEKRAVLSAAQRAKAKVVAGVGESDPTDPVAMSGAVVDPLDGAAAELPEAAPMTTASELEPMTDDTNETLAAK